MNIDTENATPPSDNSALNWKADFTAAELAGLTVIGSEALGNTITFHASGSKHIMTMTADGRLEKGEGMSDDEMTQFVFDALKNGFDTRVSRMEKELGELRDEVAAHKTAKEEWLKFANEREEVLAQVRAERDKLLKFYTEIVKELGDDLVLKRFREMRDELAHQKVENNHNWMFQEISEAALKRAESAEAAICREMDQRNEAVAERISQQTRAEKAEAEVERLKHGIKTCDGTMAIDGNDMYDWGWETPQSAQGRRDEAIAAKLAGVRAAVIEACRNAEMKVYIWYPENTRSYIHPNQLSEIYKSQVTECLAAIKEVFEPGALKRLAKNEEAAS